METSYPLVAFTLLVVFKIFTIFHKYLKIYVQGCRLKKEAEKIARNMKLKVKVVERGGQNMKSI